MEELFNTIISHLPHDIQVERFTLPYPGSGLVPRLKNLSSLNGNPKVINHITGDVNYMAFGLPPKNTVITIHDIDSFLQGNWLKNKIIWLLWLQGPAFLSSYITVISEATKEKLIKHLSVNPEKVLVIPNCTSPLFTYYPKVQGNGPPRILHLGTKGNKNLERLILALAGTPCHLRIIGKLTNKQLAMLTENLIDFSVTHNLPFNEIVEEYRKTDIVSFVSLYEGFGMPIIEAQATGRPVLTANTSSMPEVAGEGALLVNPYDVQEIKTGIKRLIGNESLCKELVAKGLENVKRFQPAVIAAQYAALYRKMKAAQK